MELLLWYIRIAEAAVDTFYITFTATVSKSVEVILTKSGVETDSEAHHKNEK